MEKASRLIHLLVEYAGTGLTNVRKVSAGPSMWASHGGGKGHGK
jgi:hypothetical protein